MYHCTNQDRYKTPNSFQCPDHNPDHLEMFDEGEHLAISRRKFFHHNSKQPIFDRPRAHKDLCPPKVKLAGMMKKCKKCRRIFNDHKKNHHILHPVCQICNHMDRTSKTSFDLACHICLRNFKNKYRLGDHMLTHDDKNPFYCSICEKGFTRKGTYDQHVLLKHSDLQEFYTCDECNQNFSSRSNLERHSKNKHYVEQTEYACNICTKKFNRRDNLLQHERNEHNLRRNETIIPGINDSKESFNFQCKICGKEFDRKFTLRRHIESLHAKKSYQCNVCGQFFSRKDKLQIHEVTHIRKVPRIICEICRGEFPGKLQLREHRLLSNTYVVTYSK